MKKLSQLWVFALVVLLSGCTLFRKDAATQEWTAIEAVPSMWATVSVDYIGTLEDGTVFDTNIKEEALKAWSGVYSELRNYTPLTFTIGQGQMIPGFENAVIGMKVGETKTVTISSEQAYWAPKAELLFTTGVAMFTDAWVTPQIGEAYDFGWARGVVSALSGDQVTIDFNHELAGKDLTFIITVRDILPVAGTESVSLSGDIAIQ